MRPELLAVRAINQYRRRDVLAYLGLRYYLESDCPRSDLWAREVSTHLVNTRSSPVYYRSYHFKELDEEGAVVCRDIYVPGPNEVLAETILLYECSSYPVFRPLPCVYSYRFPKPNSKEGIFKNYFPGFQERHKSIARVCGESDQATVRYTDIVRFYPAISKEVALRVWRSASDSSGISSVFRDLGERLLMDHAVVAAACNEGLGILTGPMFSHLIANLVLSEIDEKMFKKMKGRYWRYVDDIVLIGSTEEVNDGREFLKSLLGSSDMGFSLHDGRKDFQVDSDEWLKGARDFDDSENRAWISLIANIKRFLVTRPEERSVLASAFLENGINIPLLGYSKAVVESSYLERFSDWLSKYSWAPRSVRTLSVDNLVKDALSTRQFYQHRAERLLDENPWMIQGYERKRLIPKLRFYAGRLIFLALPEMLSSISFALANFPELAFRSRVMSAIPSRDVSSLLEFGTSAAQAAAQVLRIQGDSVWCSLSSFGEVELQALAILRLNGLEVDFTNDVIRETMTDPLNQFALGLNPLALMKSDDLFIKEIACLRGVENPLRHKYILDTALDRNEQLVFDIINRLHDSSYF
jgi:hypothetical protein